MLRAACTSTVHPTLHYEGIFRWTKNCYKKDHFLNFVIKNKRRKKTFKGKLNFTWKNPAYGRHWISQLMRIVAPIPKRPGREEGTMRGLGTDHLISGPMRGLKKCIRWRTEINRQTIVWPMSFFFDEWISENICGLKSDEYLRNEHFVTDTRFCIAFMDFPAHVTK